MCRAGLFLKGWELDVGSLRPSGLPRRRRLLCLASGLATSLTFRATPLITFGASPEAASGRSEAIADAPGLCRSGSFLLGFAFLGRFGAVLAADQLHLRDFGRIAAAETDAQDASVAAGPVGIAGRNRLEQLADDVLVGQLGEDETPSVERLAVRAPEATPRLAIVINRSTKGRSSFAFGIVVSMRSCRISAIAWLRSSAVRCSLTRPSLRYARLCLIAMFPVGIRDSGSGIRLLLRSRWLIHAHAKAQPHAVQDLLDLIE
jgi:hypothetical protein